MFLIIIERGSSKYEFLTVHKDHSDNLGLIDINTKPFIYEEKDGSFLDFDGIDNLLEYLQNKFKGYKIYYKEVEHIYCLGDVKKSEMIQY